MRLLLVAFLLSCLAFAKVDIPPDAQILEQLQKNLQNEPDGIKRTVKRMGNRTIEFDIFLNVDGRFPYAEKILSHFQEFNRWLLPGINVDPEGKNYYFQVLGLNPIKPEVIHGNFFFNLPLFKKAMSRDFQALTQSTPTSFLLTAEALPDPDENSVVKTAKGYLKAYPSPNNGERLWLAVNAKVELNSSLLYHLLPHKVLLRESGERLRIVMKNYVAEEDRVRMKENKRTPTSRK